MKILLLASAFHEQGGLGVYCRNLADALTNLGHDITIASLHGPSFAGNKLAFTRHVLAVARRFDLIFVGHLALGPLALLIRRPYAILLAGIDAWEALPLPQRLAVGHAKWLIAMSQYTASRFAEANTWWRGHLTIIRPCVSQEFLEVGQASVGAPAHQPFTILTVARLNAQEKYKGVDIMLKAISRVRRWTGNVRYVVVGDGDDRDRLQELGAIYLPGAVSFCGSVNPHTLLERYEGCDVFALPSTKEGFGITYLEAAAHGKPVIAGPGGPEEAMVSGVTGFVASQPAGIADRIVELAQDDAKRIEMGRAGHAFVEEGFTMARFTRDVEALLATL